MNVPSVTVCICTYKRPDMLGRLLDRLEHQTASGRFEFSIVVVDNDANRSAESVVAAAQASSERSIVYFNEPQANIAIARNRTLELTDGDYAAFIDDDEYPEQDWLLSLLSTAEQFGSEAVIGFVKPDFGREPAAWIARGKFFFKPAPPPPPSGTPLSAGITSNALVSMHAVRRAGLAFDPAFGRSGGEDDKFFRDLLAAGMNLVFCAEAIVHEDIPEDRQSASYLWKRHHLQGRTYVRIARAINGQQQARAAVLKSVAAAAAYCVAMPFMFLRGRHAAIDYSLRLAWHLGYIAASMKWGSGDDREQFESYMQSTE